MSEKLSDHHLNYLMGHKPNVTLAHMMYQVPDHQINSSGLYFDESQDTSVSDFHFSVACGRDEKVLLNIPNHILYSSCIMLVLIQTFKGADTLVFKKYNQSSLNLKVCSFYDPVNHL